MVEVGGKLGDLGLGGPGPEAKPKAACKVFRQYRADENLKGERPMASARPGYGNVPSRPYIGLGRLRS